MKGLSCVNTSNKKVVLIRFPKGMDLKVMEQMNVNLKSKEDVLGSMSLDGSVEGVEEKIILKRDSIVSRSVRPLVCTPASSKGKKKSSSKDAIVTVVPEDVSVGGAFDYSFTVYRKSELAQQETAVNTTHNIQPSYKPVPQLQRLRMSHMPFGCGTPVESVQQHVLGTAAGTDTGADASTHTLASGEKSSKKKKRDRESTGAGTADTASSAATETPKKAKKAKKDKK